VDEFAALPAWGKRNVQGSSVTGLSGGSNLGNGIGFGMQDIPFCKTLIILTIIFKSGWRTVITVGNDHPVPYNNRTNLPSFTI
jgi:hypothetical protein